MSVEDVQGARLYRRLLDFSGGQNDTVNVVRVAENEASLLRNINLERDGAVSKRKGASKENSSPSGSGDYCNMILEYKPSASVSEIIAAMGDKIVRFDRSGGSFTTLLSPA